jgi:hypothetical protein
MLVSHVGFTRSVTEGTKRERAKALWINGWFALRQGDLDVAAGLLEECRTLAQWLDDMPALACATHFQALIEFFRGEVRGAVTLLEEAHDRYRAEDDLAGSRMALCHLVMAVSTTGDHERADDYGAQCLALCEAYSAYLSRSNATVGGRLRTMATGRPAPCRRPDR